MSGFTMMKLRKSKQVKVKLGNADAKQQEIASGLKEGQKLSPRQINPLRMAKP
ncbi:MAG: hypothetical protein ACLS5G_00215 [Streptococcus sp.]